MITDGQGIVGCTVCPSLLILSQISCFHEGSFALPGHLMAHCNHCRITLRWSALGYRSLECHRGPPVGIHFGVIWTRDGSTESMLSWI